MKKVLFFILFAGLLSFSINAVAGGKKNIAGTWKCYLADAPSEYQHVTLVITGSAGNYNGKFVAENGYEIPLTSLETKGRKLEGKLTVQNLQITFTAKLKGKKLKGMVSSSEGDWEVVATRETK